MRSPDKRRQGAQLLFVVLFVRASIRSMPFVVVRVLSQRRPGRHRIALRRNKRLKPGPKCRVPEPRALPTPACSRRRRSQHRTSLEGMNEPRAPLSIQTRPIGQLSLTRSRAQPHHSHTNNTRRANNVQRVGRVALTTLLRAGAMCSFIHSSKDDASGSKTNKQCLTRRGPDRIVRLAQHTRREPAARPVRFPAQPH